MSQVVGDILVQVGGDVSPLVRALRQGASELDGFAARSARMGRTIAKVGAAAAAALTVGTTAATHLARRAADAAVEIDNLSRAAGASPTEFQRMAAAAQTVNISNEKLADILKDVRDRVGDFIATGAGPMADFFEKIAPAVGVTADQFARLSGPEALQLYVDSLQKVNVTQSEMVFYLEAMASDTTALLPLLKDGGRAMRDLGDQAENAGRVMSGETLAGAQNLKTKMDELESSIRTELATAMIGLEDELVILATFVKDYGIPALENLISFGATLAETFRSAAEAIALVRGDSTVLGESVANNVGGQYGLKPGDGEVETDPVESAVGTGDAATDHALNDLYGLDGEGDEIGVKPENRVVPKDPYDAPLRVDIPGGLAGRDPSTFGGDTGVSGGSRGPTKDDLDALSESLASERELVDLHYQEKLAQLDEFREAGIGKEEEWNDLEQRIQKEHADKLEEIEATRRKAKMQALAGMFGDLSSLMQSENKKLFKVGQAAALAEATISGYQAAVDAWQKGMKIGGPPVAAAFTAASLAKTGMLISSIASASPAGLSSGGKGGGGAGGAVSAAAVADPTPHQQVNLNIGDGDFFPRSAVISLAEKLQELSREGAIVTVN